MAAFSNLKHYFLPIIVWWPLIWAWGETGRQSPRFFHLDLESGLSHNMIYSIYQDQQGFMWFGTRNGLNRYDGVRFRVYHHDPLDATSLSNDNISAIVGDEDGVLWVGAWGGGLNRLDPETGVFSQLPNEASDLDPSIRNAYVHCLYLSESGELWLGTRDNGLIRFDKRTGLFKQYLHDPTDPTSLSSNRVWSIREKDGRLWLGADQGIDLFDPKEERFERYLFSDKSPVPWLDTKVPKLMFDRQNRLWVVTERGLFVQDLETGHCRIVFESGGEHLQDFVLTVYEDRENRIWWGTLNSGLFLMEGETIRQFRNEIGNPFSIRENRVRSLFEDRSGNLWIGTQTEGLNRLRLHTRFRHLYPIPGDRLAIPGGEIRAMAEGPDNVLWVGSASMGLARLDGEKVQLFKYQADNPKSLSNDSIQCIALARDGAPWIGAYNGLNQKVADGFKRYFPADDEPGFKNNQILSLALDRNGHLWVGLANGLARFDGRNFTYNLHNPANPYGIGKGQVFCQIKDRNGTMWLGLGQGGLNRYDAENDRFVSYRHNASNPESLSDNTIISLCDYDGYIWVGTRGRGLNRMDPETGRVTRYFRGDGLPNNVINAILPDYRGNLWISTNRGLSRFSLAEDGATRDRFKNFDLGDGLQSNQFSPGSAARTTAGEMFFGGIGGVSAFFPEQIVEDRFMPPVVISALRIKDAYVLPNIRDGSSLLLEPEENFIRIEFAALDYSRPDKNRFRYRLEGVDSDWIEGAQPFAAYTGLSPGNYTFRLEGSNHDGVWSDQKVSLPIRVLPPWTRTTTAYFFYVLSSVLLLVGIFSFQKKQERVRARVRLLEESEKMAVEANRAKSSFLANMSHELRTPLNVIIGYSEILEEDLSEPESLNPSQSLTDLAKIKSSAHYQLSLVNNLLELTKIESGGGALFLEDFNPRALVETIVAHMQPITEKDGNLLAARFEPEKMADMTADITRVQGILVNLLGNANQLTQKGEIQMFVQQNQEEGVSWTHFLIQSEPGSEPVKNHVEDLEDFWTTPIPKSGDLQRLGLYITKHFAERMGGGMTVVEREGGGLTFRVRLPTRVPDEAPSIPSA